VALRLIDPNMGRSPTGTTRTLTWQDEFDMAGLRCDLADDSGVGRQRFNEYLKPDPATRDVRAHIHPNCPVTIGQLKKHQWEDYKKGMDKGQKQKAKDKDDDHPTLWKYHADPTFNGLQRGGRVYRAPRRRAA
jgi:hypothetical protein